MPKPPERLSPEALAEIEQRASAATEGPWHWRRGYEMPDGGKHWALSNPQGTRERKIIDGSLVLLLDRDEWLHRPAASLPNWEFIAHAREDVPALVAHVREVEAELERLKEEVWELQPINQVSAVEQFRQRAIEAVRAVEWLHDDDPIIDLLRTLPVKGEEDG